MKIEKQINDYIIYRYYDDGKTDIQILHGLFNNYIRCIGYHYHFGQKGFWLINKD